jgi:hypothetical protein
MGVIMLPIAIRALRATNYLRRKASLDDSPNHPDPDMRGPRNPAVPSASAMKSRATATQPDPYDDGSKPQPGAPQADPEIGGDLGVQTEAATLKQEERPTSTGGGTHEEDASDDWAYRVVAGEIGAGKQDTGLWLKAFVDTDGDATRQKVAYVKARVAALLAEQRVRREQENAERLRTAVDARRAQEDAQRVVQ